MCSGGPLPRPDDAPRLRLRGGAGRCGTDLRPERRHGDGGTGPRRVTRTRFNFDGRPWHRSTGRWVRRLRRVRVVARERGGVDVAVRRPAPGRPPPPRAGRRAGPLLRPLGRRRAGARLHPRRRPERHTWDTVLLALGRPAIAVDLPVHGHSDRRPDRDYGPWRNAEAVAEVVAAAAPRADVVVAVARGATTIRLAATRPSSAGGWSSSTSRRRSVTPSALTTAEQGSVALVAGPPVYDTFDEMAQAAIALSPYRAASGVRRGVRHNATRLDDGRWTWRYDLFGPKPSGDGWTDSPALGRRQRHTAPVLWCAAASRGSSATRTSRSSGAASRTPAPRSWPARARGAERPTARARPPDRGAHRHV